MRRLGQIPGNRRVGLREMGCPRTDAIAEARPHFEWVHDVQKYLWTEDEVVAGLREILIADAKPVRGSFP